jgi:hypothetical protein
MPRINEALFDFIFEIKARDQDLDSTRSIVSNAEIDNRKSTVILNHTTDCANNAHNLAIYCSAISLEYARLIDDEYSRRLCKCTFEFPARRLIDRPGN